MHSAEADYLATEILTASPERLHLLLIEAGLRSGWQARNLLSAGNHIAASDALVRCQQIVTEMISGLDHEGHRPLASQIASIYVFIYRRLIEANFERSTARLDDALRLLEIERETWRAASQKSGHRIAPTARFDDGHVTLGQNFVA